MSSTLSIGRLVRREDLRNVAIIAHVDHGKTTLVDGMLKQSKIFRENQVVGELILDSNALEREKGITILAKNTAVLYKSVKVNIIDTPGHADFSGEVERVLNMANGCLLLVDAVDGPMPQTKFVLRKALALGLKPIVVINKIDRPQSRIDKVLEATQDLFLELATDPAQLDFDVIYTNARAGQATRDPSRPGHDLVPLFESIIDTIPCPVVDLDSGFQMLVANIRYDDYVGRAGVGRIGRGKIRAGDPIVRIDSRGQTLPGRIGQIFAFEGLKQVPLEEAGAGDVVIITGIEGVAIGDTLATIGSPEALPRLEIEPPTVKMVFGVNTSPLAGKEGKFSTSRQIRARLYHELETNIALRVEDAETSDEFLVSGRGELHLAILIETLRREGFEFQVSQPTVITRTIEGALSEPTEHVVVDTVEGNVGALTEHMAKRLGQMVNLQHDDVGNVRMEYEIPTRGLIGFRSLFLTLTRGDGVLNTEFLGYRRWAGQIDIPRSSVVVATEDGVSTAFALGNIQERATPFIGPGVAVYEGMIVGMTQHPQEIIVNITKEKKQSNVRQSTADIAIRLTPPVIFSLEESLAFLGPDELLEVTPQSLRLRKKIRAMDGRLKARKNS